MATRHTIPRGRSYEGFDEFRRECTGELDRIVCIVVILRSQLVNH